MSPYFALPLLLAAATLQATVLPHLTVRGIFPDLPILMVVSWSLLEGVRTGLSWGVMAGLAVDLLSAAPFGGATFGLVAVAFLSGLGGARLSRAHIALPPAVAFLATIAYDLILMLARQVAGAKLPWLDTLLLVVLPSAALNALLVLPVLWLMRRLQRLLRRERMDL